MPRSYPIPYVLLAFFTVILSHSTQAADVWETALAEMKLATNAASLHETNCIPLLLASFKPNPVVKCMVFLPDTTDEIYLRHNVRVKLSPPSPTLLETISALTNQSPIRVQFRAPFLLFYAARDFTIPVIQITDTNTWQKIQKISPIASFAFKDSDWSRIQPRLQKLVKTKITPWSTSVDSYHFYRHNLVGHDLTGAELIEAVALAGKTTVSVRKKTVAFELDQRTPW